MYISPQHFDRFYRYPTTDAPPLQDRLFRPERSPSLGLADRAFRPEHGYQPGVMGYHLATLMQMMEALNRMGSAWSLPRFPAQDGPRGAQPETTAAARAIRSSLPDGKGSRELPNGKFVDPLGREGQPIINRKTGQLVYVKTDFTQLKNYEKESKKILRGWDLGNLPGEPLLGPRSPKAIEWAEKHFPGGYQQYKFNRSNRDTGVEDHEQLRGLLARSRGVKPEEIDYREVMVLYGLGEHGLQHKAKAVQQVWTRNPPGDPLNPKPGFEVWDRKSWENMWKAAPNLKPPGWKWPENWQPKRNSPKKLYGSI